MRRTAVAFAGAVAMVLGIALPALGLGQPPRGSCNRGTQHAHQTVPHLTEGNHVAHMHIPECD